MSKKTNLGIITSANNRWQATEDELEQALRSLAEQGQPFCISQCYQEAKVSFSAYPNHTRFNQKAAIASQRSGFKRKNHVGTPGNIAGVAARKKNECLARLQLTYEKCVANGLSPTKTEFLRIAGVSRGTLTKNPAVRQQVEEYLSFL